MNVTGGFVAGSIIGKLLLDKTGWNSSIKAIAKDETALTGMAGNIGRQFKTAGVLIAAAVSAAAGAILVMAHQTAEAGEKFYDMSLRTGVSAELLSSLKLAADKSGTSLEGVALGFRFLGRNMVAGEEGIKKAEGAFHALGIKVTDVEGKFRPMADVMLEVADRFAVMENGAEKTALAIKLFGRSGTELIPLLNLGSAGLREQMALAEKLGVVFTEKTAKAADTYMDSLVDLRAAFTGMRNDISNAVIPALAQLSQGVTTALIYIREKIAEFTESGQLQEWAVKTAKVFIGAFKLMATGVRAAVLAIQVNLAMFHDVWGWLNTAAGNVAEFLSKVNDDSSEFVQKSNAALLKFSNAAKVNGADFADMAEKNLRGAEDTVIAFDVLFKALDKISAGIGGVTEEAAKVDLRPLGDGFGYAADGVNEMSLALLENTRLHKILWPEIQNVTESLQDSDLPLTKYTEHWKIIAQALWDMTHTSFESMVISFTEAMNKIAETSSIVLSVVNGVIGQAQANSSIAIENEYKKRLAYINATVKDEEKKQKAIAALEAEFQLKRSSARRTWAIAEKGAAIAQAYINASLAATKVLGQAGLFGIPLVPLIWALCLAQIALIAAQPIPLAEGATFPKPTLLQNVLVGEKRPEYLLDKPKLIDIVRETLTVPRFNAAPAMTMAGAGGVNVSVNINSPLVMATGYSRRDMDAAGEYLMQVIDRQLVRVGAKPLIPR